MAPAPDGGTAVSHYRNNRFEGAADQWHDDESVTTETVRQQGKNHIFPSLTLRNASGFGFGLGATAALSTLASARGAHPAVYIVPGLMSLAACLGELYRRDQQRGRVGDGLFSTGIGATVSALGVGSILTANYIGEGPGKGALGGGYLILVGGAVIAGLSAVGFIADALRVKNG